MKNNIKKIGLSIFIIGTMLYVGSCGKNDKTTNALGGEDPTKAVTEELEFINELSNVEALEISELDKVINIVEKNLKEAELSIEQKQEAEAILAGLKSIKQEKEIEIGQPEVVEKADNCDNEELYKDLVKSIVNLNSEIHDYSSIKDEPVKIQKKSDFETILKDIKEKYNKINQDEIDTELINKFDKLKGLINSLENCIKDLDKKQIVDHQKVDSNSYFHKLCELISDLSHIHDKNYGNHVENKQSTLRDKVKKLEKTQKILEEIINENKKLPNQNNNKRAGNLWGLIKSDLEHLEIEKTKGDTYIEKSKALDQEVDDVFIKITNIISEINKAKKDLEKNQERFKKEGDETSKKEIKKQIKAGSKLLDQKMKEYWKLFDDLDRKLDKYKCEVIKAQENHKKACEYFAEITKKHKKELEVKVKALVKELKKSDEVSNKDNNKA